MGRRKSYVVEEALQRSLSAFWKAGFEATSLKDLEAATGLNKFSLYDSFGSKRGLYLACLDFYVVHFLKPYFEAFEPTDSPSIERFLRGIATNLDQAENLGCFLLNGAVEFRGTDPEVNDRVAATYGILTDTLERFWGDRNRSEAFTAFVMGLMTAGRLGRGPEALGATIDGSRRLWC